MPGKRLSRRQWLRCARIGSNDIIGVRRIDVGDPVAADPFARDQILMYRHELSLCAARL